MPMLPNTPAIAPARPPNNEATPPITNPIPVRVPIKLLASMPLTQASLQLVIVRYKPAIIDNTPGIEPNNAFSLLVDLNNLPTLLVAFIIALVIGSQLARAYIAPAIRPRGTNNPSTFFLLSSRPLLKSSKLGISILGISTLGVATLPPPPPPPPVAVGD